jgi:hypothetical protein
MCFAIGWSDTNQVVSSTAMLPDNDPGWIKSPSAAGAGGTATYLLGNLTQAAEYVFFVTAFGSPTIESNESTDSAAVQAPTGPLVSSVATQSDPNFTPAYAQTGTVLQVTGQNFATGGGTTFFFVPQSVTNPSQFANWPSAAGSCTNTTSCTVTAPAPTSSAMSVVNVVAETTPAAGGPSVFSPTLVGDQVSYAPVVTGVAPAAGLALGGYPVAVTVRNFYKTGGGTNFFFGASAANKSGPCTTTGLQTVCPLTAPAGTPGTVNVSAVTAAAPALTSTPTSQSVFTYQ